MKRILFVCMGNTCRSPMAQGLMNQYAHTHNLDIQATSAGIAVTEGMPMAGNALEVLEELKIDMTYHHARQLCDADISNANLIFCMAESHLAAVAAIFPKSMDKLRLVGKGIADPFGGDVELYRNCREHIRAALPEIAEMAGRSV